MKLEAFYLNHVVFKSSKTGEIYRKLTCCNAKGDILEFFHDPSVSIPEQVPLFAPVELDVLLEPAGIRMKLTLIGFNLAKKGGDK